MVEIVAGELRRNETNQNAMGGTEMIANRMHNSIDPELLKQWQIIHSRPRKLEPNLKKMLVCHDLPGDPEVQHLKDGGWNRYDKIVFVSNWQMQMYNLYLGVPYGHSVVIPNSIIPINVKPEHKTNSDKVKLIYHTTPHRGLNILYAVFEQLAKDYPHIELDVYSSFKIYGWEQRDEQFKELFEKCKDHPQINYHGSVTNNEIREALKSTHIFAYPSTWQETSCMALMEAMSAGCYSVIPNYGALPETNSYHNSMYQWDENITTHANRFLQYLKYHIEFISEEIGTESVPFNANAKTHADECYNWNWRVIQWENVLRD